MKMRGTVCDSGYRFAIPIPKIIWRPANLGFA